MGYIIKDKSIPGQNVVIELSRTSHTMPCNSCGDSMDLQIAPKYSSLCKKVQCTEQKTAFELVMLSSGLLKSANTSLRLRNRPTGLHA